MRKLFFLTFWSFLIIFPLNLFDNAKSALEIGEDEFVIVNKDDQITII